MARVDRVAQRAASGAIQPRRTSAWNRALYPLVARAVGGGRAAAGDPAVAADARRRAGVAEDFRFPSANWLFPVWLTRGMVPWMSDGFPVGSVLGLAATYWPFRGLPNVHFVHYADLVADLDGELGRLEGFLGAPLPPSQRPAVLAAASFHAMKARADQIAPGAHSGEFRDNAAFFRRGRLGEWQTGLTVWNRALYQLVARRRLSPGLKRWIEGGRAAAGDPAVAAP